ncbi:TetR/AcrR family transcriptional regulator [Pelagibacterium limicola]|uniref:TetR/AcrR family transcriptional regulator n=1 Tax=Pelagibacterium limicola TaxID=2791022 RepID=UPI0018AF8EBC|nr:TetR/AcrR family transcriptional regulator [Pelagibacterium limicola]
MPRPKLHSDETILTKAHEVLVAKGPSNFTLTDVANAVGISRAALIQRFNDKDTLHLRVMEKATEEVRAYFAAASKDVGLGPLWNMLKDLIAGVGTGEDFAGYLLLEWSDVTHPALNTLAVARNRMVRNAIRDRLPEGPHDRDKAALLIQSVIQGSCMQWLVEKQGTLNAFMLAQTRAIIDTLYPGQDLGKS